MKIKNSERILIAHALDHLNQNKIASEGYEGWYMASDAGSRSAPSLN